MLIKIQSEIPKFKCNACGTCCSHIRGIVPKEDREFIKENLFGECGAMEHILPQVPDDFERLIKFLNEKGKFNKKV